MRWAEHGAHMGGGDVYTGFWWGNLGQCEPLGRHKRRWEDNIKMNFGDLETWTGSI